MEHKAFEISNSEYLCALLRVSGHAPEACGFITARLGYVKQEIVDSLVVDFQIEMAETLSLCWLVQKLRRQATGPVGSVAAVEALRILTDIALRKPDLFKP
ncbi:hypothetical protein JFA41_003868 [Salmonella enterica subsp. enterica serovar Poona]|nr:hypothetical protein [Salmonella enterica subsp. enterica serovar Poona]ELM0493098.1 hypothetical protein [Salmonella enterica]ELS4260413.1 hypothetical protein [Salmonella enterica]